MALASVILLQATTFSSDAAEPLRDLLGFYHVLQNDERDHSWSIDSVIHKALESKDSFLCFFRAADGAFVPHLFFHAFIAKSRERSATASVKEKVAKLVKLGSGCSYLPLSDFDPMELKAIRIKLKGVNWKEFQARFLTTKKLQRKALSFFSKNSHIIVKRSNDFVTMILSLTCDCQEASGVSLTMEWMSHLMDHFVESSKTLLSIIFDETRYDRKFLYTIAIAHALAPGRFEPKSLTILRLACTNYRASRSDIKFVKRLIDMGPKGSVLMYIAKCTRIPVYSRVICNAIRFLVSCDSVGMVKIMAGQLMHCTRQKWYCGFKNVFNLLPTSSQYLLLKNVAEPVLGRLLDQILDEWLIARYYLLAEYSDNPSESISTRCREILDADTAVVGATSEYRGTNMFNALPTDLIIDIFSMIASLEVIVFALPLVCKRFCSLYKRILLCSPSIRYYFIHWVALDGYKNYNGSMTGKRMFSGVREHLQYFGEVCFKYAGSPTEEREIESLRFCPTYIANMREIGVAYSKAILSRDTAITRKGKTESRVRAYLKKYIAICQYIGSPVYCFHPALTIEEYSQVVACSIRDYGIVPKIPDEFLFERIGELYSDVLSGDIGLAKQIIDSNIHSREIYAADLIVKGSSVPSELIPIIFSDTEKFSVIYENSLSLPLSLEHFSDNVQIVLPLLKISSPCYRRLAVKMTVNLICSRHDNEGILQKIVNQLNYFPKNELCTSFLFYMFDNYYMYTSGQLRLIVSVLERGNQCEPIMLENAYSKYLVKCAMKGHGI